MGDKTASSHLYWARSQTNAAGTAGAPPPKALSPEEVAALAKAEADAKGAAWNKASTWEERGITAWASEHLRETLLPALSYELTAASPLPTLPSGLEEAEGVTCCKVRVASVETVKGEATYFLSRGKERVVFELQLKLKLDVEAFAGEELKTILSGTINIGEVRRAGRRVPVR